MVFADVALGQAQGVEKFRLRRRHGLRDLLLRHQHGIELRVVEFLRVFQNRPVAVLLYVGKDRLHHARHVRLWRVPF